MIGARKGSFAEAALEGPIARVFAIVAGELVGAGELPSASLPRALVRFLARVRPQMRLQMRRFRVRLGATRMRTRVNDDPPFAPSPSATGTHRRASNCRRARHLRRFQVRRRRRSEGGNEPRHVPLHRLLLRLLVMQMSLLLLVVVIIMRVLLKVFAVHNLSLLLLNQPIGRRRRLMMAVDAVRRSGRRHLTLLLRMIRLMITTVLLLLLLHPIVSSLGRVIGIIILLLSCCCCCCRRNAMSGDVCIGHPLRMKKIILLMMSNAGIIVRRCNVLQFLFDDRICRASARSGWNRHTAFLPVVVKRIGSGTARRNALRLVMVIVLAVIIVGHRFTVVLLLSGRRMLLERSFHGERRRAGRRTRLLSF